MATTLLDLTQQGDVATITDVAGNSHGRLVDPTKKENRVDYAWEKALADIKASKILTVEQAGACRTAFELFHAAQIILLANLVETLDHFRFHANAHILRALHQKRLVDQIPQQVFLLFLVDLIDLF